ncbi:hypothetical protein NH340_JMT07840 [Sarcoptes scabiei]|nr:hypothetical protein NH340_JMT07840 [Sarcoptes scabiei]
MLPNLLLSSIIIVWFKIMMIDCHYHETQLPKGYGVVQKLLTNLTYSNNINVVENSNEQNVNLVTTIPNLIDQSYPSFTFGDGQIESRPIDRTKSFATIQFLWNVYNFTDLLHSEQELIFSPRFYLNEPGFRLQMLLITNTTYADMSSYLGVFFRLVAGDYDAEVEWPYRYRTTLSVLQHHELEEWISKTVSGEAYPISTRYNNTIIPNIDECRLRSAFLRPNSDIEISLNMDGCGNRRHMPLDALESDHYLRDDTLIVMLTVQLDDKNQDKTFQNALISMRYNEMVSNFLWSIENFSAKKNESVENDKIVILNSDPFYTHPHGYLIQLFLTILPKRSAFAISMAFIQGDHDRYLQWPFPYPFEMAIVDQSPDYWKRDLTIKMQPSKSDCGAEPFGQPSPQLDFCFLTIQSLHVLSLTHYNFLLNDTLKIRLTTKFERYSSRKRASLLMRNNRLVSEFNWLIPGLVARFQRQITEIKLSANISDENLFKKTHRYVSDEFYTNGQGYLCQLVLTVSVRNLPINLNRSEQSTELNRNKSEEQTISIQTQDVLVFNLELVIIEGEFDRFLDWPFNNAYELALIGYKNLNPIGQSDDGGQFYFDKTMDTSQTNSQLIIPSNWVESGVCAKESFQKPIKQNPPCGIKEFVQMDIGDFVRQRIDKKPSIMNQKLSKVLSFTNERNESEDKFRKFKNIPYDVGSLSKSEEDLHLRVRIYL